MSNPPSSLAVIPARAGSKRVPDKNIRPFRGRPLLAWPVETALACDLISRVIVSTDDPGIAAVARAAGADVPFLRPAELADDFTPTVPVVSHAVSAMAELGETFDHVFCIYPAAVSITVDDLAAAQRLLLESPSAPYVATVMPYAYPIQRALRQDGNGLFQMDQKENLLVRSQDLPPRWHDAGQFYLGPSSSWLAGLDLLDSVIGLELASWRFHDIDTLDDWRRAEVAADIVDRMTAGQRA